MNQIHPHTGRTSCACRVGCGKGKVLSAPCPSDFGQLPNTRSSIFDCTVSKAFCISRSETQLLAVRLSDNMQQLHIQTQKGVDTCRYACNNTLLRFASQNHSTCQYCLMGSTVNSISCLTVLRPFGSQGAAQQSVSSVEMLLLQSRSNAGLKRSSQCFLPVSCINFQGATQHEAAGAEMSVR